MHCDSCGREHTEEELSFGYCWDCLKILSKPDLDQMIANYRREHPPVIYMPIDGRV